MSSSSCIAYPNASGELARQVREAALDHEAFEMPLKPCELASCRATCCHDGVYLDDEQAAVIGELVEHGRLGPYGIDPLGWQVRREGRLKTATVAASRGQLAERFPEHFPETRCVFLDDEHRCALQRLAVDEGRHPWWWKPISCWMHPLLLKRDPQGRPVLGLARPGKDPAAREGSPGFGSCTPCGMPGDGGEPAWKTLQAELRLLGAIGGRDLFRELSGHEP